MYIANVADDGFEDNPHLDAVNAFAAAEGAKVVAICNQIEAEISELDDADKREFLADIGMNEPGLDRVIRAGYELLSLQTYFTAGVKEVRAWTVKQNATAPQAAGVIHTDFEKGFIRAEVVGYDDFIAGNGEQGAKEAGKWRQNLILVITTLVIGLICCAGFTRHRIPRNLAKACGPLGHHMPQDRAQTHRYFLRYDPFTDWRGGLL